MMLGKSAEGAGTGEIMMLGKSLAAARTIINDVRPKLGTSMAT